MDCKYTINACVCAAFLLVIVLLCSGCHAISRGYENTTTYFNIYYNAKQLFDEAEDEIRIDSLVTRAKGKVDKTIAYQIPGEAKQKLDQVIDKCSNILVFHSTSKLVDDALLMIGKSFFYQGEYLKAERKFEELLTQYPASSLVLEGQLWYAKTEEKLGKLEEGVRLGEEVVSSAQKSGNHETEVLAHQLLASLYLKIGQNEKAISECEKTVTISKDNEVKGNTLIYLGDIYFSNNQYEKAIEKYLLAGKYTSEIYLKYYSGIKVAISYRKIGDNKKGLTLLDKMIQDFRYRDYLPSLLFERANNYFKSGEYDKAVVEYIYVDTTYAKTEYAAQSAYRLGLFYEKEIGNYQLALKYYSEVSSNTSIDSLAKGHVKFLALTSYFDAWQRITAADSLIIFLKDTANKQSIDTIGAMQFDSTKQNIASITTSKVAPNPHRRDPGRTSSRGMSAEDKVITDSTQSNKNKKIIYLPHNIDSLMVLKSIAAQEIGDVFYSDILVPDSAFYWYNLSLTYNYDRNNSPRILFILSELSRNYPEKKFLTPEDYYKRLEKDFPESIYTKEVQRLSGNAANVTKTDKATEYYIEAEKQIEAKQPEKSLEVLYRIVNSFPKSPLAAKSEYAIGWILENNLQQPDSAMVHYRNVVEQHPGTIYAFAASRRLIDTIKTDTARAGIAKPHSSKIDTVKQNEGPIKTQSVNLKGTGKDTANTLTNSMNRSPVDSLKEIERKRKMDLDIEKAKLRERE